MDELIKLMDMVCKDIEKDMKDFEGREFNGKNVAELFGYQAAAILAVAQSVKVLAQKLK